MAYISLDSEFPPWSPSDHDLAILSISLFDCALSTLGAGHGLTTPTTTSKPTIPYFSFSSAKPGFQRKSFIPPSSETRCSSISTNNAERKGSPRKQEFATTLSITTLSMCYIIASLTPGSSSVTHGMENEPCLPAPSPLLFFRPLSPLSPL